MSKSSATTGGLYAVAFALLVLAVTIGNWASQERTYHACHLGSISACHAFSPGSN